MRIGHRLIQFIPVLLGITLLAFGLLFIAPNDAVSVRLSAGETSINPEVAKAMRAQLGLDKPFFTQYGMWLLKVLQGDFGFSLITDLPIADMLLLALPFTLKMATLSMVLTLIISVPTGIFIASCQNSKWDYIIRFGSFVVNAIPNFIVGLGLLYLFSYYLGWIPVLATSNPIGLILPSLTLAIVMSSRYIRQVRAATLDELGKDYVVGLRAKGLKEYTILYRNVIKNVLMVVITLTGVSIGSLLGGTVVVETIFNWPGLGHLLMDAITKRDYPVVQAIVVWMSFAFLCITLITDISYTWINPKVKKI